MKRRISLALLATTTVLMLLPAAEASAEPNHRATLDRATPKFTWESSGSGVPDPYHFLIGQTPPVRCTGAPFRCDYILLDVEAAGELTLTLENTDAVDPSFPCGNSPCELVHDIDGRLYRSNAAGDPVGNTLTRECVTVSSSETCKVAVGPGFYLVEVEYAIAVEAHYVGTVELAAAPGPPAAEPQMITLDDCTFTLYYFKDSAERLQALVPPGYRVRPYGGLVETDEESATIAATAYDCGLIEVPGSPPAPAIFTVLSVLVYPPDGTLEGPASSDFYVLWIHANNPQLVELLASRGMPAYLVPGMTFERSLQHLAARVEVPWSPSTYELEATGPAEGVFHSHDNTYMHGAADGRRCNGDGAEPSRRGCLVRMDFVTARARDHFCFQPSADHHAAPCGKLTAQAGTPVASFFGASDRTADNAWDHYLVERSWFVLQ